MANGPGNRLQKQFHCSSLRAFSRASIRARTAAARRCCRFGYGWRTSTAPATRRRCRSRCCMACSVSEAIGLPGLRTVELRSELRAPDHVLRGEALQVVRREVLDLEVEIQFLEVDRGEVETDHAYRAGHHIRRVDAHLEWYRLTLQRVVDRGRLPQRRRAGAVVERRRVSDISSREAVDARASRSAVLSGHGPGGDPIH